MAVQEVFGIIIFIALMGFIGWKIYREKYRETNPMLDILNNIEKKKKG